MKKNINQYVFDNNTDDFKEFIKIAKKYMSAKNYIYSSFSGVGSYLKIKKSRKHIRDVWTENCFIDNWNINRRYIRNAIEDSVNNIKASWTNTIKSVKKHILDNDEDSLERYLIFTILKVDVYLYNVLNEIDFELPKKFKNVHNKKQIYSKIRRLIRDYKPNIPHTNKLSLQLDSEMYSYKDGYIEITSNIKNKRLKLKVNNDYKFKGCIRLVIDDKKITISKAINIKPSSIKYEKERIAIDRNFINMIDTNTNSSYGLKFNELTKKYCDTRCDINKKRRVYIDIIKKMNKKPIKTKKDIKKIENITKHNLGYKKFNKNKNRDKEELKKYINKSINEFIDNEKPKEIVVERLNFTYKKKSKYSRNVKRLLNTWMKGLFIDRLKYKTEENGIKLIEVNAAYTSQECSLCHHFGVKRRDIFYCNNENCENSKGVKSGHEAARVILQRGYDDGIKLTDSYKKVKEIIQLRLRKNKPTQPRPNSS